MKNSLKKYCNTQVCAFLLCLLFPFCVQADVVPFDPPPSPSSTLSHVLWIESALVALHLFFCIIGYWRLYRKKGMHLIRVMQVTLLGSEIILLFSVFENNAFVLLGSLCFVFCLMIQFFMSLITGGWFSREKNGEISETKIGKWLNHGPILNKIFLLILGGCGILTCIALCFKFQNLYEDAKRHESIIEQLRYRRRRENVAPPRHVDSIQGPSNKEMDYHW